MEPREQAASLPEKPGVYLFKDASGTVVYVGKARSLRNRVRSYFLESRWVDAKTGSLAREIADLETIVVDNEREALALENNLIKQYKPKFNVMLRDDKTYPYIKLTMGEKYPRVYFTRKVKKDGALYFGPYFPVEPRAAYPALHSQTVSGALLFRGPERSLIPARASSFTSSAAWGRASPDSPPTSATRKRSATCACFSKAVATI